MATDYLPRLSSAFSDKAEARRIINEQTEVLLFFIGPVIVLIISHAPFMVEILYSDQFFPAADMLRLQLLGDVLKVMSWPLSFAIVAAGKGRAYVLIEIYSVLIFSLSVYILIPFYGLNAAGIAFVLLYVTYLPLVHYFGGKPVDFAWSAEVKRLFGMIALTSFLVFLVCSISEVAGAFAGTLFALLLVLYAMTKLSVWSKVRRLIVAAKVGW
jgi:PST family polysaccharide transporter